MLDRGFLRARSLLAGSAAVLVANVLACSSKTTRVSGDPDASSGGSGGVGGSLSAGGSGGVAGSLSTGGTSGDSGASPRCDKTKSFSAPQLADFSSTNSESRASMSSDGLTLYFDSDRDGGNWNIYTATWSSDCLCFTSVNPLTGSVNGPAADSGPVISAHGFTLYFNSLRDDPTGTIHDIYVATRATLVAEFANAGPVANVNSTADDWVTSISGDGGTLYIGSNRGGAGDIHSARLDASGSFEEPRVVAELNSPEYDGRGQVTPDTLAIYFTSDRPAPGAKGDLDIFMAHRSTVNDGFGTPELVEELNTSYREWPAWISPDECQILIATDRPDGAGGWDLYWATR
jgi:hypothetical protein